MKSTRRYRGALTVSELLSRIARLDKTAAHGYTILDDACYAAYFYLKVRAKLQRTPATSFDAAMVIVARQEGILTEDEWENKLRYLWGNQDVRNLAIDALYERFMGRKPQRTSAKQLAADAAALWDCVKVPYTEAQFEYLERAWQHKPHRKEMTFQDRQLYCYQPLDFEKPLPCDRANEDSETDRESVREWIDQRLDERDEEHSGRYGYGVRMPRRQVQRESEPVNPEMVDHAEQAHIDAAFSELMAGFDI